MKIFVSLIILTNLLFSKYLFADALSEAKVHVASTQEAARAHAEKIFLDYLKNNIDVLSGNKQTSNEIIRYLEKVDKLTEQIVDKTHKVQLNLKETEYLSENKYLSIIEDIFDLIIEVKTAEANRDYWLLSAHDNSMSLHNQYTNLINQINYNCEQGVSSDFSSPDLPPIVSRPPAVDVMFNYTSDLENPGGGYLRPDFTVAGGDDTESDSNEKAMYYTLAYAAGTSATASVIKGELILSATKFGQLTTAEALTSFGYGAAAAVAVAAIVYTIEMDKAIRQSKNVTDALWTVFNDKADSGTVEEEFKKLCEPLLDSLNDIQPTLNALSEGDIDNKYVKQYEAQKKEVSEHLDLKMNAEINYNKIYKKLTIKSQDLEFENDQQRDVWVTSQLSKTDEYKKYQEVFNNTDKKIIYKFLYISLINYAQKQNEINNLITEYKSKLFIRSVDVYLDELARIITVYRNMDSFTREQDALINKEIKLYQEIGLAYREFDESFSQYIRELFVLGQTVNSRNRLIKWFKSLEKLKNKFPNSASVGHLLNKANNLNQNLKIVNMEVIHDL